MFNLFDHLASNPTLLRITIFVLGIGQFISRTRDWGFELLAPHTIALVIFMIAAWQAVKNPKAIIILFIALIGLLILLLIIFTSNYAIESIQTIVFGIISALLVSRYHKLSKAGAHENQSDE